MSCAIIRRRPLDVEIKLRARKLIKARKNVVRGLKRAEDELRRSRQRLEPMIDRLREQAGDLEAAICVNLRQVGPLPIGEHWYYAVQRIGPDGMPYDELVEGNPDSALDRAEAERPYVPVVW